MVGRMPDDTRGAGGMATLYLAQDPQTRPQSRDQGRGPELAAAVLGAERFIVEIKMTAALQHPHILPLFDSGFAASPERGEGTSLGVRWPTSAWRWR
jgi:hypothetical protein